MTHTDTDETTALQNRLRRLEGQIRGIQRMLEDGRHCDDVLTQVMAVRSGVEQVGKLMLDHHIEHCVLAGSEVDPGRIEELKKALRLGLKFTGPDES